MKVNIWIKKEEAISGNITEYHEFAIPQIGYQDYVSVQITTDEFARLEDTQQETAKSDKVSIEVYDLIEKYSKTKGGDFPKFWEGLSKEEQIKISEYYEW